MNNSTKKATYFLWLLTISCAHIFWQGIDPAVTMPRTTSSPLIAKNQDQTVNFERYFRESGIKGSILIYDAQNDRTYQYNEQRNQKAVLPGSTFKILNSLISLETKTIDDEIAILTWDGIPRFISEWNRDLNMKEAFKFSAVWFYQVLARKIGHDQMQSYITQSDYGNQDIGEENDIDTFWLTGKLLITPQEQVQFLHGLYSKNLPFSERSLSIVKDIMIVEQTSEYTIRAKTGLVDFEDQSSEKIGWYVGYLEKGNEAYFFATNIEVRDDKDLPTRINLTRRCLEELKLL